MEPGWPGTLGVAITGSFSPELQAPSICSEPRLADAPLGGGGLGWWEQGQKTGVRCGEEAGVPASHPGRALQERPGYRNKPAR